MNIFDYFSRVNFNKEDLSFILKEIIKAYSFEKLKDYHVIERGYEDFNVYMETVNHKYVVKFFNNERKQNNIEHYAKVIENVIKAKSFRIPHIYKMNGNVLGYINFNNIKIEFFVMDFIEGKTIYELNKNISLKLVFQILFDMLKYNCTNADLKKYLKSAAAKKNKQYDIWGYEHFVEEYNIKSKYLSDYDKKLMQKTVLYFKDMILRYQNYSKKFKNKRVIPAFMSAHNDFISTNIIIDKEGNPNYVDFSVSALALNFVDVAIYGCDTVLKPDIDSKTYARYLKIISYILYRAHIMEFNYYPASVSVQHAIHLLEANYYKVHENVDSTENNYFINIGRRGLEYLLQENLIDKPVFNWIEKDGWYERAELSKTSEYSMVIEDIKNLGLEDFIETNIKEYLKLYNKSVSVDKNIKLDDLYHNGYDFLYSCIDDIKKDDVVYAISFCNDNNWNFSKEERILTNLNIKALNRGVQMQRIFVYPDNRKNLVINNKEISKYINYSGNNLKLSFISDNEIEKLLKSKINYIKPGILMFNENILFKDIIDDKNSRGYTIFNKKEINKYKSIFNKIKLYCENRGDM